MLPEVNKYYLTVPKKFREKLKSWELQKPFYEEKVKHANDKDVFDWGIFLKENGKCIGKIDTHDIEENTNSNVKDVGWYIDPIYQGNGYASEAANAMFKYMFNEVGISEIKTGAAIINPASWKIMERFGFTRQEETNLVYYTFLDEPVEEYIYTLTKEEYQKQPTHKL